MMYTEVNEDLIKGMTDLELVSFMHHCKKHPEDKHWLKSANEELRRRADRNAGARKGGEKSDACN